MGPEMPGTWSRSLLLLVSFGLVCSCDAVVPPPQPKAPVVAPVKKPVPTKVAPVVKKKPKTVDVDFGNDGGGGGGWG